MDYPHNFECVDFINGMHFLEGCDIGFIHQSSFLRVVQYRAWF